jgi:hypothetical protein
MSVFFSIGTQVLAYDQPVRRVDLQPDIDRSWAPMTTANESSTAPDYQLCNCRCKCNFGFKRTYSNQLGRANGFDDNGLVS